MDAMSEDDATPAAGPDRLPPVEQRLTHERREELRRLAEAVLLYSPKSWQVQAYLRPDWGDIRKGEWQEVAIAALEASGTLRAKLQLAEDKLDAICVVLDDEPS